MKPQDGRWIRRGLAMLLLFLLLSIYPTGVVAFSFDPVFWGTTKALLSLDPSAPPFSAIEITNYVDDALFVVVNLMDGTAPPLLLPPPSNPTHDNAPRYLYDYETTIPPSRFVLTRAEERLFAFLLAVRQRYCPSTTLRIVGGWVRDKLLEAAANHGGLNNSTQNFHDIDVVLSDVSGVDFGRYIQQYLEEFPEEVTANYQDLVIQVKPMAPASSSSSRHLQTASLKFGDLIVDLGRSRYETGYKTEGRVPTATGRGAPVQDAFRRDFTVNALYYNLHTQRVEDWTEQGLFDLLVERRLTTPQTASASLAEDPLRVLRAARFAAQLSPNPDDRAFTWHPDLQRATQNPRVARALRRKVSRDGKGREVQALFNAQRPSVGLRWLLSSSSSDSRKQPSLLSSIFELSDEDSTGSPGLYRQAYRDLVRVECMTADCFLDRSDCRHLFYAAWLYSHWQAQMAVNTNNCTTMPGTKSSRQQKRESVVYQCLSQALSCPNRDVQSVQQILNGIDMWHALFRNYCDNNNVTAESPSSAKLRSDVRWDIYQRLKKLGPLWKDSLILTLSVMDDPRAGTKEAVSIFNEWVDFVEQDLGLGKDIFDKNYVKPLLNGREMKERALPGLYGTRFREALQAQEEWQVRNGYVGTALVLNHQERHDAQKQLTRFLAQRFPELCKE